MFLWQGGASYRYLPIGALCFCLTVRKGLTEYLEVSNRILELNYRTNNFLLRLNHVGHILLFSTYYSNIMLESSASNGLPHLILPHKD